MPQTLSEIRAILASAGLRPQKHLGQHFLIDGNLLTKMVDAAGIQTDQFVLEVGAGTGSLTEMLLERAGHVVAVEVDRGLHGVLSERLAAARNLTLLHSDVLATKSRLAPAVQEALLAAAGRAGAKGIKLVANLPYHVASPLLICLLLSEIPLCGCCFSVQREVADRITASPGCKDYGPLSIVLQACSRTERVCRLPPNVFWPAPRVESMVLRLDVDLGRFAERADLQHFSHLVRLAFGHRRKTLHYNLRMEYDEDVLQSACSAVGVDWRDRAEALDVATWLALARQLGAETKS